MTKENKNMSSVRKFAVRLSPVAALLSTCIGHASAASVATASASSCAREEVFYNFASTDAGVSQYISMDTAGNIYAVEVNGGINETGRIIRVSPSGQMTVVHDFAALDDNPYGDFNADGATLNAAPILASDGNFYGVAQFGGVNGEGTVYQLTPAGNFTLLHTFAAADAANQYVNADGERPVGALTDGGDGYLYGSTMEGGAYGSGVVFKIAPDGSFDVLYNFGAPSGSEQLGPVSAMVLASDGNLYGANTYTTLFRITRAGVETDLYDLNWPGCSYACDNISGFAAGPNGLIVGATNGAGETAGSLFSLTTSGVVTTTYSFGPDASGQYSYGAIPMAGPILAKDGNFYATAYYDGAEGGGTFYELSLNGPPKVLFNFNAPQKRLKTNKTGAYPGGVVQSANGSFYGVTQSGGTHGYGTLYKLVVNPSCV